MMKRLLGWRLPLSAAALAASGAATAQQPVPAEWTRYAQAATQSVAGWLNGQDEAATGVRAALTPAEPTPEGQPMASFQVRLWIAPDGVISRAEPEGVSAAGQTAVQTMLLGKKLPPPPRKMRQPLRLGMDLSPAPEAAGTPAP